MEQWTEVLLERMLRVSASLLYLILGAAAAIENLVPPIPADVIVLMGGFLSGQGRGDIRTAFFVVWTSNIGGALIVYWLGFRYGERFFAGRFGRLILRPHQLASLARFYGRFGFSVIFVGRLFPMFRAVVPAFAGVSRLGVARSLPPLALASGLWYGMILYIGAVAGENWQQISDSLASVGHWLYVVAVVAILVVVGWWWRSRSGEE